MGTPKNLAGRPGIFRSVVTDEVSLHDFSLSLHQDLCLSRRGVNITCTRRRGAKTIIILGTITYEHFVSNILFADVGS